MIIVKVWGGLGNQLFQYCFGKYVAAKLNTTVKYDIQTMISVKNFTQRKLAISFFNTRVQAASEEEINQKKYCKNHQLARIERKIAQTFPSLLKHHIVEANTADLVEKLPLKDDCYYEGYWQSYKYLLLNEQIIRQEITLNVPANDKVKQELGLIKSTQSVSIHVRRGDYLTQPYLNVCDMYYYEKAMAFFTIQLPQPIFYIFTDDSNWCRENFIGNQYVFIEGNEHYEDMYLMSQCQHNIIANSTFSWWAAWLNSELQKMVVAPKKWHNRHQENDTELMPDEWIKID